MRTILVTDYLDKIVTRFPNKIAFADEKQELSFCELRNTAAVIASEIIHSGKLKKPFVVYMEKSPNCVAAFLGVAYSGNFYSPIDVNMPVSRVKKIMETLQPTAVITDADHACQAAGFVDACPLLIYEDLLQHTIDCEALKFSRARMVDTDVLYVLFTSGSTGTPKGVIISHKSVIDYIEWLVEKFSIDEKHVIGNQAPLYFDLSIQDIYGTLRSGCTTYLLNEKKFLFPVKLFQYMAEKNIDTIFWVPTALCLIANLHALNSEILPPLRKILFCGEVMSNKQLNQWRRAFENAMFVNLYGPTEITEVCTYFVVDRMFADDECLPIGFPCENTGILVLNEYNRLVQKNEIGELCVYGTSLAYGYYNESEKTADAFVQNPLNNSYPEIIYRTGDLVRYNKRGELVYVCRKDFQIKHMGHRIELGEIETNVASLSDVDLNVCLYDELKKRIVLLYTGRIDEHEIKYRLKQMLPEYMLPGCYFHLKEMPLNLNGKIDRQALKKYIS